MTRENQRLIGGIIVALLLGMFIGAAIGEDFPLVGTAADNPDDESTAAESANVGYYLVSVEDASLWLTGLYPDLENDVNTVVEAVVTVNDPNDPLGDPRLKFEDLEADGSALLHWSQLAVSGYDPDAVPSLEEMADFEMPKDRDATVCLGVDDDPFALDGTGEGSGIYLYMIVPEPDTKNIDKDWEEIEPKDGTDMFWMPLECDPTEEEAAAE